MKKVNMVCIVNIIMLLLIIIGSLYLTDSLNKLKILENYEEQLDNADLTKIEDNVVNEKCAPCDVDNNKLTSELLSSQDKEKDVSVMFGTPTQMDSVKNNTFKNNQENAPSTLLGDNSLFLFKNNECSIDCCEPSSGKGTDYSCDTGCICYNKDQNNLVASRGDNVYPSEVDTSLKFKQYEMIIKDKYNN